MAAVLCLPRARAEDVPAVPVAPDAPDALDALESPEAEPNIPLLDSLDSGRDAVSAQVTNFANWLDNFFGNERIFDESQKSQLKLNLLHISEKGSHPRYDANLQGKLTLPNTQKRLNLLLESDNEDTSNPDNTVVEAVQSQTQTLGLSYTPFTSDWLLANTDIGVRFHSGLDTFVRFRLRGLFPLGSWQLRAIETLFWRDSTGPGETSQLDFERRFAENYLFRSTSQATWLDHDQQFELGQDFFLFHNISKLRGIVYRAGVTGISEPDTHATAYILSIRLRQQIHRDWLFFEINPQIRYPVEEDFTAQPSLTFKLEIIFGGPKRNTNNPS